MKHEKNSIFRSKRQQLKGERGIALITTLLLLMLLSALTLAMAWSARSDMMINGYYRNFRGSFYAADSGINIMRQALNDQFIAGGGAYPKNFNKGSNPLPSPATENQIMSDINANYGTKTLTGSGTGSAAKSWPENYAATIQLTQTQCTTDAGACVPFPASAKTANFVYSYTITSVGKSNGQGNTVLTDSGMLQISATIPTVAQLSFAGFGMFIDQNPICDGSTLVAGTITGPVFTNGSWNFGTGSYTFTGTVGSAGGQAGYQNGACQQVSGSSGNGISPTFQQGFTRGATKIPLPTDSFNQQQAVLDGVGVAATQPTPTTMNPILKDVNKNAYPSNKTPSSGVFLPYSVNPVTGAATFTGGGILVEGDASVVLAPSGTSAQVYTITQNGVVTTITINPVTNTTVMTSGAKTVNISGVPQQYDPSTHTSMGYETMLFVDGDITSLSGPGQGKPAIQDGTALTVTADTTSSTPVNITITGDILYKKEPVTGTPFTPGSPIDALIPGNDTKQALGIYTTKGDIQMANSQANGTLEIDASLAMLSQGGSGGLTNTGNKIDTLTIVGGRIQNNIKNINTTTRNVLFDQRFTNGFAPPWFPSTGITPGSNGGTLNSPVLTRMQWLNKNAYY